MVVVQKEISLSVYLEQLCGWLELPPLDLDSGEWCTAFANWSMVLESILLLSEMDQERFDTRLAISPFLQAEEDIR